MIKEYLTNLEHYYYKNTELLADDYHKGRYDLVVKLLDCMDGYKHERLHVIEPLGVFTHGKHNKNISKTKKRL